MGAGGLIDLREARARLGTELRRSTYEHSLAVSEEAVRWAPCFGVDPDAARWAGLLHDCAKGLEPEAYLAHAEATGMEIFEAERKSPPVLHQRLGARWAAERFGVKDPSVLAAIRCHTTGARDMDGLARCLFTIDWVSPERSYEGVETLRSALSKGPDAGFLAVLRAKRDVVRHRGLSDHPWAHAAIEHWLNG